MSARDDYPWLPITPDGIDQYYAMADEIDRLRAEVNEWAFPMAKPYPDAPVGDTNL